MRSVSRIERDFHDISDPKLRRLLKYDASTKIDQLKLAVAANQKVLDLVVADHLHLFPECKLVLPTSHSGQLAPFPTCLAHPSQRCLENEECCQTIRQGMGR